MELDPKVLAIIVPLLSGYFIDLVIGDPHWIPHPVRFFGWLISGADKIWNNGKVLFVKGMLVSVFLIAGAWCIFFFSQKIAYSLGDYCGWAFCSMVVFFGLANKCLISEGRAVFKALSESLDAGRKRLSWIVGRDTSNLTENQVRIAVFETMAENLSDGVVAPLFYYALGGVPAMMAYKMVNTLDSMIGYKNNRYEQFGKFAARCDDVANFFPTRITALLIALVTLSKQSFQFIFKYGNKHSSPNSGYPEAAMAGYLNCRFGGPNYYKGLLVEKPFIGRNERTINKGEITKVIRVNHWVTAVLVLLILLLFVI
jgi:adenosylcobinamide-phosphate synthase